VNWTDVFTDTDFANGDYTSEVKLDQWKANHRYARERLGFVYLLTGGNFFVAATSSSGAVKAYMDETPIYTGASIATGTFADYKGADIDISGYADWLHNLRVGRPTRDPLVDTTEFRNLEVRFIKAPEMDRLSIFYRAARKTLAMVSEGSDIYGLAITSLSVILHREVQGW
jgi:hypothetical protein